MRLAMYEAHVRDVIWEKLRERRGRDSCPPALRRIESAETIHLRLNIALPIAKSVDPNGQPDDIHLRIVHTHGMDDDTDDQLEFPDGVGAVGKCWKEGRAVLCDLVAARSTSVTEWRLTKYQQRLVRPTLTALLSIPVTLKTNSPKNGAEGACGRVVAVLSFDTDQDLLEVFGDRDVQLVVAKCASDLAGMFRGN